MRKDFTQRLAFLRELFLCSHELYSWTYTPELEQVYTNCHDATSFDIIFSLDTANQILSNTEYPQNVPIVQTNSLGFAWVADFEHSENGTLRYIHVLGPALYEDISQQNLQQEISRLDLSTHVKQVFLAQFEKLPAISLPKFLEYGIMLHYVLTGDKISSSDFFYFSKRTSHISATEAMNLGGRNAYAVEQGLMRLIETGNLDYRKSRDRLALGANLGKISDGNPIRQIKNMVIIYTALCTRAAVRGGLSPETAFALSDQYIIQVESCGTVGELAEVNRAMQDDFVQRVHKLKVQSGVSAQIRECCSYIQLHIHEKLTVRALAEYVGYEENYLTQKFRREMGIPLSEYIAKEKVERAKLLIDVGEQTLQEIAGNLGYNSQSRFGEVFKKYTGMTPAEYRRI